MNSINSNNQAAFEWYKKAYPRAFKNINLNGNVLSYRNKTIILNGFDFQSILDQNNYMLNSFNGEELFKLIDTNFKAITKLIPPTKAKHETTLLRPIRLDGTNEDFITDEIISFDSFIILINKTTDYSKEEKDALRTFFELYTMMLYFEGFLLDSVDKILNEIKRIIFDVKNQDNSKNNEYIITLYNQSFDSISKMRSKHEDAAAPEFRPMIPSGYVSAAAIIYTVLNLGIALALFLLIK